MRQVVTVITHDLLRSHEALIVRSRSLGVSLMHLVHFALWIYQYEKYVDARDFNRHFEVYLRESAFDLTVVDIQALELFTFALYERISQQMEPLLDSLCMQWESIHQISFERLLGEDLVLGIDKIEMGTWHYNQTGVA